MNPSIPTGNQNQFFGQKVSKPGIDVNNAGDNDLIYKNDFTTTLYYNSSGIPTVLLGLRPLDNEQGLFVSQPGIDVTEATDSQLIFNSQQNIFKIVADEVATIAAIPLAAGQLNFNTLTIPHGLPFIPVILASAFVDWYLPTGGASFTPITAYVTLPYNALAGIGDVDVAKYVIQGSVDATNVYFSWFYQTTTSGSGGAGYNFPETPIKYYLLQETAN